MDDKFEQRKEQEKERYQQLVDAVKPKPVLWKNCLWAFGVGGGICCVGQICINLLLIAGKTKEDAGALTTIIMIFLGALLTGIGVYDKIGKHAGAGSIVPITGFSNAIVAPAMEFKREGYIFGVGARIFSIAGPTLLFGFAASTLVGIIYFFMRG